MLPSDEISIAAGVVAGAGVTAAAAGARAAAAAAVGPAAEGIAAAEGGGGLSFRAESIGLDRRRNKIVGVVGVCTSWVYSYSWGRCS